MTSPPDSARVVIIGGGAIGLSVAYHLGQLGCTDVLLLERNTLTSGTSWHAAGIVGPLRASMNLTTLAKYATELFVRLETQTGQATGYKRTGGLWLAQREARLVELRRIAAMGEMNNLGTRLLAAEEILGYFPLARIDDLVGALFVADDAQVNPVDLCMAYAKGAKTAGIRIFENTAVTGFDINNSTISGVRLQGGTRISCEIVINCAGLWAHELGALAGVCVPLAACEHMYVVTEPVQGLPNPCPVVRDLDAGVYVKEDAGKLVIGAFEANAKLWNPSSVGADSSFLMLPEDWDHAEPMLESAIHRVPCLENTGIQHFMNGPESFTPDTRQIMGQAAEVSNYFVAAGFNSIGVMSSAGVGKVMAEWVLCGHAPMDLWEVDILRFDPSITTPTFVNSRLQESVYNQFDMHWPFKQYRSGRDIQRSTLHSAFEKKGAVFGAPTGWERPLWYAQRPEEQQIEYSFGVQSWWPYARREAQSLCNGVVLFELTPFTKISIRGADAKTLLQKLCCNDVDVDVGRVVYTPMLNKGAGIEVECTVTRVSNDEYLLVSGAATRIKDLNWIQRHIDSEAVAATDRTTDYVVLGVMGPKSRALLRSLTGADLSAVAFPFGTSLEIDLASTTVRATRVSFVGELGWELYIATESAEQVHALLCDAGVEFELTHAGHYCLDGCRLEKGYLHWGHDVGPEDTPLEVGLGFTISFDKTFIGCEALRKQKASGVTRYLLLFSVNADKPLLLHDEPIYCDGKLVGQTTSGGLGFRTGLALCHGMISVPMGTTRVKAAAANYEISIAGDRYALKVLDRPPYDPTSARMRN